MAMASWRLSEMRLASGVAGELLVGYQVAARLGAWAIDLPDDRMASGQWRCVAEVVTCDDYWLRHGGPCWLRLAMGDNWWTWQEIRVSGSGPLTITGVGRPVIGQQK